MLVEMFSKALVAMAQIPEEEEDKAALLCEWQAVFSDEDDFDEATFNISHQAAHAPALIMTSPSLLAWICRSCYDGKHSKATYLLSSQSAKRRSPAHVINCSLPKTREPVVPFQLHPGLKSVTVPDPSFSPKLDKFQSSMTENVTFSRHGNKTP